jgi:Fe-S-cluster containining protein
VPARSGAYSRTVEHVYFTWPDRRFRYECRGCGACCKGHGIGIDVAGGQLVQLLARRPALAAFLRRRGDAITAFNPRDRCWFLADDGLCRIEVEDGRAAKPASCRLFPFNRVFRLGPYTIVDYNSVICPLTIGDDGITHASVAAELATITDPTIIATPLPASRDPGAEARAFVDTERAIAAAIFAAPGDLAAAWAAQAETAAAPAAPANPAAQSRLVSLDREREIAISAFTALLGAPCQLPSAVTLAAATWLTPSLRFNELYGPRQYAPRPAMAPILARMWLAWLGFAALGEQLAARPLSLQELTTLWSEQAPLMHAIARWTEPPILKPGPIDLPSVDPGSLVRSLAQSFVDNRKLKKPLGDLLAALPTDSTSRITALKSADSILRSAFVTC